MGLCGVQKNVLISFDIFLVCVIECCNVVDYLNFDLIDKFVGVYVSIIVKYREVYWDI